MRIQTGSRPAPRHHHLHVHTRGLSYLQPKPRLASGTFHSLPKPQGWLHSRAPSWAVPCLPDAIFVIASPPAAQQIKNALKRNISFSHPCVSVSNFLGGGDYAASAPMASYPVHTMRSGSRTQPRRVKMPRSRRNAKWVLSNPAVIGYHFIPWCQRFFF